MYSFGARSFSIWEVTDAALVQTYDSGDRIEQTLFAEFPSLVDDGRSDNKGPEPEHVAFGEIGGSLFAFVGLERSNAVMAFEIEGPTEASFAGLLATDGDEAPEVFSFVPAADTPDGAPLLAVPNEESGTTTTYELEAAPVSETFTLQILHASDFEAGVEAVERAPNFAAIVDALEEEVENSITLSSGDNFIPGPFTAAGTDPSVRDDIAAFYEQLLGQAEGSLAGIRNGTLAFNAADNAILNAIGVQASAIGNHEFDLGPTAFAGAFDFTASLPAAPTAATLANVTGIGALFPYLSANLEFGAEAALSGLFTPELRDAASYATTAAELSSDAGIRAEAAAKEVAPWTSIEENGETIGVLGLTTQVLASISSVGNVTVADPAGDGGVDNMDELAGILQPLVDEMAAQGIDKIILLSHLQQIANERELATKLSGVDVIIGGGSHTVFADATDPLEPGDTAGGDYPEFFTGADGKAVALVNTGANYTYVGRLVVTFDENGEIIPDSVDPDVSGANVTSEEGVDAVAGDGGGTLSQAERDAIFADGTRGGEAKQIADAVGAVITAKDSNVVGFTDVFLEGRRNLVRSEETNLGDLTSDANLAVAKSYDLTTVISLKNGGGIRAEIGAVVGQPVPELLPPQANPEAGKPEGGVSQLDIENSLRFNNGLSLITLDAQGILNAVENAVRGVAPGATPGAFPQISGLNFSFDPARAALDRVVDLAVVDQQGSVIDVIAQGGELVGDTAREFRVVTLNFLADGGDGIIVRPGQTSGTLPVYEDVAELDRVNLYDPAVTQPDFETVGREQAALADLLSALHGTPEEAFDVAETPPSEDERTQNLSAREGEVIGDGPVEGAGRDDLVVGTGLGDTITGVGGDDTVAGVDGRDLLRGNTGEDALSGADGRDTLTGGGGDDTLVGGADADRLKGGGGDDALTGEAGADIFVFTGAVGDDTITNFAAGEDRIGLVGLGFADFAAVQTAAEDTGDGVLLTLDADTTVLIEGASLAGLQAADFVLA